MFERIRNLAFVSAIVGTLSSSAALAQGFPCNLTQGVQPQQSYDCSNPPLTFKPQGYTGGTNGSVENVPIGNVAYSSLGTSTTYGASGDVYITSIFVPGDMTVTNINFLTGAAVTANTIVGAIYNAAGTLIGNSVLTGTATVTAHIFTKLALTSPIVLQGPGTYFIGIQANGTTDSLATIAASTFIGRATTLTTGTFGVLPAITPPTTFTALQGPIVYLN